MLPAFSTFVLVTLTAGVFEVSMKCITSKATSILLSSGLGVVAGSIVSSYSSSVAPKAAIIGCSVTLPVGILRCVLGNVMVKFETAASAVLMEYGMLTLKIR